MTQEFVPGNRIVVGSTRSGKSMAAIHAILSAVMLGWAVVCIDPHSDSLGWNLLVQLTARGFRRRVIFDRLSCLDRVPGYNLIRSSNARCPLRRKSENEELRDQLVELASRRRGTTNLALNPQTEEFTHAAFDLLLQQDHPLEPDDPMYVFEPTSRELNRLIRHCTADLVRQKFQDIQSGKIRPNLYAASKRLIQGTVGSTAFRIRCGQSFDLGDFLNNRGVLIVEGGYSGVSDDAKRTIMGGIILQTIQFIRRRRRARPRVLLCMDEATNAGLIGEAGHEVRALAECQKWGLDCQILVQQPIQSKGISEQVFSNCVRHEWFYNSNVNVCRQAAADLGNPNAAEEIRSFCAGERYVRAGRQVFREYVPLLPDPWTIPGLADKKARIALAEIRRRPEFQSPAAPLEDQQPSSQNTSNSPETEMDALSSGPNDTFARPDISSLSSPADRLPTDDLPNSDNEVG